MKSLTLINIKKNIAMKHIKKFENKLNESHDSFNTIKNTIEGTIYDLSAELDDYTTNHRGSIALSDTFVGEFDGKYHYELKITKVS